jgi:ATP synthase I subunit
VETLKRFRLLVVRYGLLATVLAALVAFYWNPVLAKGILAGGVAGVIGFWAMALSVRKIASASGNRLNLIAYQWTMIRMVLYALALWWAYTLDRDSMHGVLGAAGGLLIVRFVLLFVGITSVDLRQEQK